MSSRSQLSSLARRMLWLQRLPAVVVSAACLIGANLFLVYENQRLLRSGRQSLAAPIGAKVSSVSGFEHQGAPITVPTSGEATLLVVLSADCPFSLAAQQEIAAIVKAYRSVGRVVVADITPSARLSGQPGLRFEGASVVLVPDPRVLIELNVQYTPTLILLDPAGTVAQVWTGGFSEPGFGARVRGALGVT